jgi:hypothetical protein
MQFTQITREPIVNQPDPSTANFRRLTLQNANVEHEKNWERRGHEHKKRKVIYLPFKSEKETFEPKIMSF